MNSRERLLTALNHQEPDRVPIDFGGTGVSTICYQAYDGLRQYLGLEPNGYKPEDLGTGAMWGTVRPHEDIYTRMHSDVCSVGMGKPDAWDLKIEYGDQYDTYIDEWGITVCRPKDGHYFDLYAFPIKEGTLEAFRQWKDRPDPLDPGRWRGIRERALKVRETGRAIAAASQLSGGILEQASWIMGHEEFFVGIASDDKFADEVLASIFEIQYYATVKLLEEIGDLLDVFVYGDDLSGQEHPLVNPEWAKRHLAPHQRKLFDKVKSMSNAKVFYHSCGAARPWIPYLIDIGVDILNPVQVSASGMDTAGLKRDFGADLVFWGGACDSQRTLPFGTPDEVRAEVRKRIDDLAPGGGFVFANIHNIQDGVPPENIVAMFDTCSEYGVY